MHEEAIHVFHDMITEGIQPTVITMVTFLSTSANLYVIKEGKHGHAISIITCLDSVNIIGTSLINLYSKSGSIEDAQKIFNKIPNKDTTPWKFGPQRRIFDYTREIQVAIDVRRDHETADEGVRGE
ncbi:hypothetical protein L1887_00069 [Cichorium endivia]|nr:hypothetical protein L1887_00069 [Cichorium endivia]